MENYITNVDILNESKECFLTYSEEVLTDRAIPNAEDGLLSVHRKLIWTAEEVLKMNSKSKYKKSASIVGSTLASSYFHGDAACYGAMCKMAQEYLMRYPLIDGEGNFGTQEGNGMEAASRYTNARPSIYADLMMNGFKKNVVPLKETYNGEYMEPVFLPSSFPNAIVNGKEAIGVSMAHNSMPHNLSEVCDAIVAYMKNKNMTIDELLEIMPGPDFPLGGTVINTRDVKEAYTTGHSRVSLKVRGDYEIKGNEIIFTSIPYRTYRNKIKEQISKNVDELEKYIDDFRDESNVGVNRLIFEVSKGVSVDKALNKLFSLTDLQTTLSYNMNYIVDGTPKLCSMLDLINAYVNHQDNVLIKATEYDKQRAGSRAHILEGLVIASDNIDTVIELIKTSTDKKEAAQRLKGHFTTLTDEQVKAILDMKLSSLTKMDKDDLLKELEEKNATVKHCELLLDSQEERYGVISNNVLEMKQKYGDARRTKLINISTSTKEEEVYVPEECVLSLYDNGTVKRTPKKNIKIQKRKGKGVKTTGGNVVSTVSTNTVDKLLAFSNKGRMYQVNVGDLPENQIARIGTFVEMGADETIVAVTSLTKEEKAEYICFTTKNGMFKKSLLSEYSSVKNRKKGINALKLKDGDSVISVDFINDEDAILITHNGLCLRFKTTEVNPIGKTGMGVKGINLKEGDYVVSAGLVGSSDDSVFVVAEDGHGKRVNVKDINVQGRGGRGSAIHKGVVAAATLCNDDDDLLICGKPNSIGIAANEVPHSSKTAQGVKIINGSIVTSVVRV
jgi:DNA gyrase subunit A